jgi:MtN3 and saliva related transmembrane protein
LILKSALKFKLYAANGGCQARIMSRMPIDLVGYVAAILTTIAFVPQALTSWRTRDLSGVSLPMYSIFTAGVAMWLAYGVMLGSWPIIVANTITLALSGTVLTLKVMHR